MEQDYLMSYQLTADQVNKVLRYFGKEDANLEEYEVAELLDKIIDELQFKYIENINAYKQDSFKNHFEINKAKIQELVFFL